MPELRRSLSPSLVRLARAGAADAELLARFVRSRDESAFAALVERHGPMVLGVCRRALGDIHTADDAFQATFLALARNAGRVREPGALAAWLYGAAVRVARTARRTATRAGAAVRRAPRRATADPLTEITGRELVAVVDEELARLPEPLRAPVLLCCIDGLSQDEAARRLGWSPGSVRGRLTRGRERLRQRLARRGIALSSGLALCSVSRAGAVPPAELTGQSVRVAVSDVAPPAVAELAKAAARYAYLPKLAAIALLSLATVGIASFGGGDPAPPPISKPSPGTELVTVPPRLVDQFGDPLPTGAVARLGSARWRHEGEAKAMAFAPDGRSLAVLSGNDGAVSFFATDTGKLSHRLRGPGILNLAYAPDGSVLAAQNGKADVDLYDAKTKQLVRTLKIPGQPAPFGEHFQICCFSSDGKRVAANSGSATIAVWDPARAEAVATITGHNHSNPGIVFTADGTGLLVAAGNPVVHLYDARTGKFVRGFNPDQRAAFSLAVSNDGKVLASGGRDRIALTEFETGKELGRLDAKMGAVLDMGFTPDGKTLVSGAEDGKVRVWDVATHKARFVLDGRGWIGRSMALSNDGTTVALGGVYNVIRLWDVATGKERFDLPDGHDAPVHAVAFSPDGRLLVTGGENQQTRLWDPATGRVVRRLQASSGQVSLSPDGRQLVSAWMFNPKVRVWDVDRGAEVKALTHEGGEVQVPNAAFTADGRSILSVSWRRSDDASSILKTWDRETGKSRQSLELPGLRWPRSFAVSPEGRWAAVGGSGERPVRLVDLKRARELRALVDERAGAASLAFSPDSRVLAVGAIDMTIRLVEVETRMETARLSGHERTVTAVAFAPGGRVLASAEGGPVSRYWKEIPGRQTIRFWDLSTGRELARLSGHDSSVNALAFAPDGRRLVTGQADGSILVWEMPAAARPVATAGRKLNDTELAALWADLAGVDVRRAYDAVWALAGSEPGVEFLAASLRPAEKTDPVKVRQWLADLDGDKFADREAASRLLAALGEDIESDLRAALTSRRSEEGRQRVQKLLDALSNGPPARRQRDLRAVWALELNGTPAARKALAAVAKGDPDAKLTREAKAAVARLAQD